MFMHNRPDIKSEVGIYLHALRTAAAGGYESIIKLLMEKAGDANNQSPSLGEVLCAAATGGHQGIIKLLLDKGADANARGGPYGNVLTMACMRELPEATKDLLDKGADANASVGGFGKPLHTFMGKRVSYWNDKSTRILKSLLEAGADIHPHGSPSALKLAISRGHLAPITILLSKGADPNIVFDAFNKHFNHSLLIESLFKSQPEIAMELLRYGADPNAKTSRRLPNQTALHLALENSSEGVVRLLLQKGADPNGLSGYPPFTPLQLSVKKGCIKYVRLLLEHGADVAAVGGYSKNLTATQLAVQTGNDEILRTLEQEAIKRNTAKRKRKEAEDESSDRLKQPRS
ncbi:hypothetical protein N0V92_000049 [Colletotrichum tropicale]|nr:hypothetical protein N0V92_000049 [Colletotrichum tropicale]